MFTRYRGPQVFWGVIALVLLGVVVVAVLALLEDDKQPASIERVEVRSDATSVVVTVRHLSCGDRQPEVSVQEDERMIFLRSSFDESGSCDDVMVSSTVLVALDELPGSRNVVVPAVAVGEPFMCLVDGERSERCIQQ